MNVKFGLEAIIRINRSKFIVYLLLVPFTVSLLSCEKEITEPRENQPPSTTIFNIPVDNDTIFALFTFEWDGGDPDGYIAGFEYRYSTYHVNQGDSTHQPWQFTPETKETIAFDSKDILNKQFFEVRAVDDKGAVDPTPATKQFYTSQATPPEVQIQAPANNAKMFAVNEVTDWWNGVRFSFTGSDDDGEIVEYLWKVDSGEWVYTTDTTFILTPDDFDAPLEGKHTLYVNAVDNTNIQHPSGDSVSITLVVPDFTRDLLIIDETDESAFPSSASVKDSTVDRFYAELFGTDVSWDYYENDLRGKPLPPLDSLGQYKVVVWHADNRPSTNPHYISEHVDVLQDYMNVGGSFVMSGWRILKSFAWREDFPVTFPSESFVAKYLHIMRADETPYIPGDFIGADGVGDFSDVAVDSTKLATFPFNGKLSNINIVLTRAGFTEELYRYQNLQASSLYQYRGRACGLKYLGTKFNAVILGFPLFFLKQEDAKLLAQDILETMGL